MECRVSNNNHMCVVLSCQGSGAMYPLNGPRPAPSGPCKDVMCMCPAMVPHSSHSFYTNIDLRLGGVIRFVDSVGFVVYGICEDLAAWRILLRYVPMICLEF